jgi:hypothetical protein
MNDLAIFVIGLLVSLVVGTALTLLVWAAILDGRTQHEFEETLSDASAPRGARARSAAETYAAPRRIAG